MLGCHLLFLTNQIIFKCLHRWTNCISSMLSGSIPILSFEPSWDDWISKTCATKKRLYKSVFPVKLHFSDGSIPHVPPKKNQAFLLQSELNHLNHPFWSIYPWFFPHFPMVFPHFPHISLGTSWASTRLASPAAPSCGAPTEKPPWSRTRRPGRWKVVSVSFNGILTFYGILMVIEIFSSNC